MAEDLPTTWAAVYERRDMVETGRSGSGLDTFDNSGTGYRTKLQGGISSLSVYLSPSAGLSLALYVCPSNSGRLSLLLAFFTSFSGCL